MAKRASPKPAVFHHPKEEDYWHSVQDIAFRAGAALVERDGETILLFDDREQVICRPSDPDRVWFATWKALDAEFPLLSRLWCNGRAMTKPGEMSQGKPPEFF